MNNISHQFPIAAAEQARAIEAAARAYAEAVTRTRSDTSFDAMTAEVALMEAVNCLWPDWLADLIKEREDEIASDYPDDEGDDWDPSLVHPDNPCQRVYWRETV